MKTFFHSFWLLLISFHTCLAETAEKAAPKIKLAEGKAGTPGITELVVSLVLVLLAIVVMAWLLRRFGGFSSASTGFVKVLGGVSLGGREKAVLVEVGGQQLLLGVAPGRVQTLHVLETPLEAAHANRSDQSFSEKLKSMMSKDRQR